MKPNLHPRGASLDSLAWWHSPPLMRTACKRPCIRQASTSIPNRSIHVRHALPVNWPLPRLSGTLPRQCSIPGSLDTVQSISS